MTLSETAARLLQAWAPKEKTREALVMSIQAAKGDLEDVARDFGMKRGQLDRWILSEELRDWHRACWPPPIPAGFVCFHCKRRKPPTAKPPFGGHCLCGESTYWVDSSVVFGVRAPVTMAPATTTAPATEALAQQLQPAPLTFAEHYDLIVLQREFTPRTPATYATQREELEALRSLLQGELQEARALTQDSPTPWSYAHNPALELKFRRPLAEAKVKAEEEAANKKARLKREAGEERLAGLQAKKAFEVQQARLKQEAEEERLAGLQVQAKKAAWQATQHDVLSPRETEVYALILRDPRYGDGKTPPGDDPPAAEMGHHHIDRACGKMHWSLLREAACSIVRREEAERAEARRPKPPVAQSPSPPVARAPMPATTEPSSTSSWSSPARGSPPTEPNPSARSPSTRSPERVQARPPAPSLRTRSTTKPTTPGVPPAPSPSVSHVTHSAPQGRDRPTTPVPRPPPPPTPAPPTRSAPRPPPPPQEQSVPERREQVVPGLGTRVSALREQPGPVPPQRGATSPAPPPAPPRLAEPRPAPTASSSTPVTHLHLVPKVAHSPLAGHILTVTREGNYMSVNGILKALKEAGHGARRQDIYAEIGAMLTDGRLMTIHGVIKPERDG